MTRSETLALIKRPVRVSLNDDRAILDDEGNIFAVIDPDGNEYGVIQFINIAALLVDLINGATNNQEQRARWLARLVDNASIIRSGEDDHGKGFPRYFEFRRDKALVLCAAITRDAVEAERAEIDHLKAKLAAFELRARFP